MRFTKIIIAISLLVYSCKSSNCNELKNEFQTYAKAKEVIEQTEFPFKEMLNTDKSSWIKSATFYSCDLKVGYFLYRTKKSTYIHKDMPIELWNELKEAKSIGAFYNKNIKKKFQLIIPK